jgi:rhodanese-related sulfurtransferase
MHEPARTLAEALLVAAAALGAGLLANALGDDGLSLTRDYFLTAAPPPVVASTAPAAKREESAAFEPAPPAVGTAADDGTAAVFARLQARGLQTLTHAEALAIHADPAREAGLYVFVDARSEGDYRAGHIPGAVPFDRYHPEQHLDGVLAACTGAAKIVVYCIGQDCEDSELAALDLAGFGLPAAAIHVYVGGYTEWTAAGLPVETGAPGGGDG